MYKLKIITHSTRSNGWENCDAVYRETIAHSMQSYIHDVNIDCNWRAKRQNSRQVKSRRTSPSSSFIIPDTRTVLQLCVMSNWYGILYLHFHYALQQIGVEIAERWHTHFNRFYAICAYKSISLFEICLGDFIWSIIRPIPNSYIKKLHNVSPFNFIWVCN